MEKSFFSVERVFFESYINILSSDAFRVLLKMLYLSRQTHNDVKVRSMRSLRQIVGLNVSFADSIWNQLIEHGLVNKKERGSRVIYTLNGTKISEDNAQYIESQAAPRDISVTVFNSEQKFTNVVTFTDDELKEKIESVFGNVSDSVIPKLVSMINILKKYYIEREKRFRMSHLSELLTGLVKYDSTVLERVCNRYISDVKISGKRGLKYVLKMAEGISNDDNAPKIDEQLSERMASKRKEEGELKFAVKLATGNIEDSLIYKRLLKTNETDKLNHLWKKGVMQLRAEGRLDEIDEGYDWLEKG
jgi:predicted transcriptional regulator